MFIQTEATSDPGTVKFLPGKPVMGSGTAEFADIEASNGSPLARRLFAIDGVARVALDAETITVAISDAENWLVLKPAILGAIMEHFVAGDAVIDAAAEAPAGNGAAEEEDEVSAQIRDLIDTRIRPAVAQNGGDVIFHGFEDGLVILEMVGGGWAARGGIENMLRHYVPEVTGLKDYLDTSSKPGLNTPEAQAILQVLEERINPSVASHGGHISLVDVQDDTVYIRLEGGCQGCGMADVTLKQGIEVEIKRVVPQITTVLDTTDHAGGSNPYYEPGKGGMSPV
ncbi:MAG: NifU family protein [Proteobacteria bacterium]|nr:NifU family protein [Pseudomonadota bacterium]